MTDQAVLLRNRFILTVSITLAALMQTIDSTIANVALPHIQGSMAATQDELSWILTSYILAAAIMTPPSGFLANRFGRKNVLVTCTAGFVLASALCGAATSLTQIVFFRFLQGAVGAPILPIIQAVLLDLYSDKERGKAMTFLSVGVMLGPVIGPVLGGFLTAFYSWRWVFYINLPIGAIALAGMVFVMRESDRDRKRRFDFLGFGALTIAVIALQLALDRGQSKNWFSSTEIVTELMLSGLCFYLFVVHTFTTENPFIDPKMFRDRNFLVGLIFSAFSLSTMMGTMALMPLFLQNLLNIPVLNSGLLMAPRGVGTLVAMLIILRMSNNVDARWMLLVGLLITGWAMGETAGFTLDIDNDTIIRVGFVQGIGLGFTIIPVNMLLFSTLDRHYRTEASAISNLLRNLSGSLMISLLTTLLAKNTQIFHAQISETVTQFGDALPTLWDWHTSSGAITLNDEVTRQATGLALFNDFKLLQWIMVATIPLLILFRKATTLFQEDEKALLD